MKVSAVESATAPMLACKMKLIGKGRPAESDDTISRGSHIVSALRNADKQQGQRQTARPSKEKPLT